MRALVAGRLKLSAGGRGTDREVDEFIPLVLADEFIPPGLALEEGGANGLTPPCGGLGTLRLVAICGALRFAIVELLAPRFGIAAGRLPMLFCAGREAIAPPRADTDVPLREAEIAGDGLAKLRGGVRRLTVGREKVAPDG